MTSVYVSLALFSLPLPDVLLDFSFSFYPGTSSSKKVKRRLDNVHDENEANVCMYMMGKGEFRGLQKLGVCNGTP